MSREDTSLYLSRDPVAPLGRDVSGTRRVSKRSLSRSGNNQLNMSCWVRFLGNQSANWCPLGSKRQLFGRTDSHKPSSWCNCRSQSGKGSQHIPLVPLPSSHPINVCLETLFASYRSIVTRRCLRCGFTNTVVEARVIRPCSCVLPGVAVRT